MNYRLLQQYREGTPEFLEGVRQIPVHSVDRFQGDENEKIVLSLVRWNKENKLGFSAIPNRICVALSRAQCGLYVIGQVRREEGMGRGGRGKGEGEGEEGEGGRCSLLCRRVTFSRITRQNGRTSSTISRRLEKWDKK